MDFQLGGDDNLWTDAKDAVSKNAGFVVGLIIVLVLVIVYYAFYRVACKVAEKFSPTQTMMFQDSDQVSTGNRYLPFEHAAGDRGSSAFAQQVQAGDGGQLANVPGPANVPGTLNYQILHSPDYNCNKRDPAGSDAWSWMNTVAHEQAAGRRIVEGAEGQPRSANDLSRIMAGH